MKRVQIIQVIVSTLMAMTFLPFSILPAVMSIVGLAEIDGYTPVQRKRHMVATWAMIFLVAVLTGIYTYYMFHTELQRPWYLMPIPGR